MTKTSKTLLAAALTAAVVLAACKGKSTPDDTAERMKIAEKWVDTEFQPSTLNRSEQLGAQPIEQAIRPPHALEHRLGRQPQVGVERRSAFHPRIAHRDIGILFVHTGADFRIAHAQPRRDLAAH